MTEPKKVEVANHEINILSTSRGERHFTCLHGLVDTLAIWNRLSPVLE